jgi:hypothetical protein
MKRLLALAAAALCIAPGAAHATGLTVIGFDDINSDGVWVTSQYAPLGVTFGSNADFQLDAPEHGCGAPITGSNPPDYDGGGRWIEPPRCGASESEYFGTTLSFGWAHQRVTLFALALPGYSPTIRLTGYIGANPDPMATVSQALSSNYWSPVTLSSDAGFDSVVIDSPDAAPAAEFVLDSLQFDAGDSPIALTVSDVSPTAGSSWTGTVAQFTDRDSTAVASDFTAQITWGDGTTSSGTVTDHAGGGFDISGAHSYPAAGSDQLAVSLTKARRSAVTQSRTIQVAPAGTPGGDSTSTSPPVGPHAAFSLRPSGALCGGQAVQFDASASTAGSSPIVSYRWTLYPSLSLPDWLMIRDPSNADQFETPSDVYQTTTVPYMAYTYNYVGMYVYEEVRVGDWGFSLDGEVIPDGGGVRLIVTDANGITASVTHALNFVLPWIHKTGYNVTPVMTASCSHPLDLTAAPSFPGSAPVTVQSSKVTIPVACSHGVTVCGGLVTLTLASGGGGAASIAAAAPVVGRGRFMITGTRRTLIRIALNARGRALARHHLLRRIRVTVSTLHLGGGAPRTISHVFSIHG